ncbi:DUF680 domain-containing protein [Mesorhizobium sp. B2-1-8]|uniref:DUF680 domain-containing protein n=1 Tax=Mesorhizobium sp. B2-1-8 TaxID=2589967 RepID=UPI00112D43D0|nr:DUF680 domain-containing protein [Mesorhizobium sp. B2-1-8]UCI19733.1 DUF680 domain-containing protein [Mesorhizobium sp. B2-1-8]
MKKIVLTAAALLAISGSAFAGSDNYGANQPASAVDSSYTASTSTKTSEPVAQAPAQGSDRNLFGR